MTVDETRAAGPAAVLTVTGICCVVLGGLVAAVTGPLTLEHGSWAAAYLVLVGGMAQWAMGYRRSRHGAPRQATGWAWGQVAAWNGGNVLVIAGTLTGLPLLVDIGSAFLVGGLVIAFHATVPGGSRSVWAYRIVLLALAISIPIGILLSHLRHG